MIGSITAIIVLFTPPPSPSTQQLTIHSVESVDQCKQLIKNIASITPGKDIKALCTDNGVIKEKLSCVSTGVFEKTTTCKF